MGLAETDGKGALMAFTQEQKETLSAMLAEHGFLPLNDLVDPDVIWARGPLDPKRSVGLPYISINFADAEASTGAPPYSLDVLFDRGDPRKDFETEFSPDATTEELFALVKGTKAFEDVKKASDMVVTTSIGSVENKGFFVQRFGK